MKMYTFALGVILLLPACAGTVEDSDTGCGSPALVDNHLYHRGDSDDFDFAEVEVQDNCLKVVIRYGGGCREVKLKLAGSEEVHISGLPQRDIRLLFEDNDPCEALVTEAFYFDLVPLRIKGNRAVRLNLSDWGEPLLYEY